MPLEIFDQLQVWVPGHPIANLFKGVPARVCQTCDEQYVDEATTTKLLEAVDEAAKAGVQVDIREYMAA